MQLERWARSSTLPHRVVLRSRILLRLVDGASPTIVARELQVSRETVRRWRDRVATQGLDALLRDRPGRGRPAGRTAAVVARILDAVARHPSWSVRRIAEYAGASPATVQRVRRDQSGGLTHPAVPSQLVTQAPSAESLGDGKALASVARRHNSLSD